MNIRGRQTQNTYTRGVEKDMLLGGWVAGWLRPREAQRGPERWSVDRKSLSCAWLETTRQAPHRFLYGTQEEAPADYHYVHRVPNRNPLQTHKQNYDQGGSLCTSRSTTREPMYVCTHKQNYDQGTGWLAGWLGGWRAGWLRPRDAQRCPERPREPERG